MKMFKTFALGSVLAAGLVMAQAPSVPSSASGAASTAKTASDKAQKPKTTPQTDADIADAKSKNMVWVNLNSKKYHKSTYEKYGKTGNGKFMTEADAKAAGNVEAKDQTKGKKATAAAKQ